METRHLRAEIFVAIISLVIVLIMFTAAMAGRVEAALLGGIALVMLMISTMMLMANYLLSTGRFTPNTIIYWWIFAIATGLFIAYAVARGVLPLVFGGALADLGLLQFEQLLSWVVWLMPVLLIAVGFILAVSTPKQR